jgi:hypothetical protein
VIVHSPCRILTRPTACESRLVGGILASPERPCQRRARASTTRCRGKPTGALPKKGLRNRWIVSSSRSRKEAHRSRSLRRLAGEFAIMKGAQKRGGCPISDRVPIRGILGGFPSREFLTAAKRRARTMASGTRWSLPIFGTTRTVDASAMTSGLQDRLLRNR